MEKMRNLPELKYMPASMVESWITGVERRLANPAFDHAAATY